MKGVGQLLVASPAHRKLAPGRTDGSTNNLSLSNVLSVNDVLREGWSRLALQTGEIQNGTRQYSSCCAKFS